MAGGLPGEELRLSSMVDTADEVSAELCQTGSKCDEAELLSGRALYVRSKTAALSALSTLLSSAVICATALLEHSGASIHIRDEEAEQDIVKWVVMVALIVVPLICTGLVRTMERPALLQSKKTLLCCRTTTILLSGR